jgi:hypothetical protein
MTTFLAPFYVRSAAMQIIRATHSTLFLKRPPSEFRAIVAKQLNLQHLLARQLNAEWLNIGIY